MIKKCWKNVLFFFLLPFWSPVSLGLAAAATTKCIALLLLLLRLLLLLSSFSFQRFSHREYSHTWTGIDRLIFFLFLFVFVEYFCFVRVFGFGHREFVAAPLNGEWCLNKYVKHSEGKVTQNTLRCRRQQTSFVHCTHSHSHKHTDRVFTHWQYKKHASKFAFKCTFWNFC